MQDLQLQICAAWQRVVRSRCTDHSGLLQGESQQRRMLGLPNRTVSHQWQVPRVQHLRLPREGQQGNLHQLRLRLHFKRRNLLHRHQELPLLCGPSPHHLHLLRSRPQPDQQHLRPQLGARLQEVNQPHLHGMLPPLPP